jgi:hypothetical protein
MLSEPEDEENSDTVLDRPLLTASTLKKGLQVMDYLVSNLSEVAHFVDRCLKFKHEIYAVMSP